MSNMKALYTIIGIIVGLVIGIFVPRPKIEDGSHMQHQMQSMNMSLQGKTGNAFDKEFIDQMIVHHQGAIDMARLALTSSNREEIRSLAQNIIGAQEQEINTMKRWKGEWFSAK
jgi:uncharacterized protein (DUF305 family)